jgi:ornithine decarboxylase
MTDVICANPASSHADLRHLLSRGVHYFTVDSLAYADDIRKLALETNVDPQLLCLLIRVNYHDPSAHCNLSEKFGISPSDAHELFSHLTDLGLTVKGVAFHLGSQSSSIPAATAASRGALELVRAWGIVAPVIDVGGGFPSPYEGVATHYADFACALSAPLTGDALTGDVRTFAEPGRVIVSPSPVVARVIAVARRDSVNYAHLDAGAYHGLLEFSALSPNPLAAPYHALLEAPPGPLRPTRLVGPTCDGFDTIFPAPVDLPPLEVGDALVFEQAGAYSLSCSSPFNGCALPGLFELPQ